MRLLFSILIVLVTAFHAMTNPFVRFEEKGKVGLKDEMGRILIPAAFEALGWSDGNFSVIGQVTGYKLKNHWGIIHLQKQLITPADFESLTYPGGERILVSKKINPFTVKFGCVDLTGKLTIPFQYDGIAISGLRAVVFVRNGATFEYGLIDLNDRSIIPQRYHRIHSIGTLRYGVENSNHKTALFSEEGVQLTDFVIDSISSFRHGMAVTYQNFAQGLVNREGEIKIKSVYREIKIHEDGAVFARDFDEWKILDAENHVHQKINADYLAGSGEQLYQVTLAGKTGLLDKDLKMVLPLTYDFVGKEDHGNRVVGIGRRYGVIRKNASLILPLEFDSLVLDNNFVRGSRLLQGRSSWSLYDTFGIQKTVGPFDFIGPRNGNFFPVKKRGYWGAMNRYGEEFIHCVFDSLLSWKEDLFAVQFRSQFGIIDKEEKWLLSPQRYPVGLINEDYFFERHDTTTFLRNLNGEIIYFTTQPISLDGDCLTEVLPDGTVKYVSFQGVEISRSEAPIASAGIQSVFPSSEGFRAIKKDGKYGFVDARGRLRIANRYDDVGEFHEGLAPVKLIGKWGYVNVRDQVAINPNYESVGPFVNQTAIVWRNGKAGLIDPEGKTALAFRYDSIQRLPDQTFRVKISTLYGLADPRGNVLIEPRFDVLRNGGKGYVIAGRAGKFGLLTLQGFSKVPMIYDGLVEDHGNNQYIAVTTAPWKELKVNSN